MRPATRNVTLHEECTRNVIVRVVQGLMVPSRRGDLPRHGPAHPQPREIWREQPTPGGRAAGHPRSLIRPRGRPLRSAVGRPLRLPVRARAAAPRCRALPPDTRTERPHRPPRALTGLRGRSPPPDRAAVDAEWTGMRRRNGDVRAVPEGGRVSGNSLCRNSLYRTARFTVTASPGGGLRTTMVRKRVPTRSDAGACVGPSRWWTVPAEGGVAAPDLADVPQGWNGRRSS